MDSFIKESSRLTPTEASKQQGRVKLPVTDVAMQSPSGAWLWHHFTFPMGLKLHLVTGPVFPCERWISTRNIIRIPWLSMAFASPRPVKSTVTPPLSRPNTPTLPTPGFCGEPAVNLGKISIQSRLKTANVIGWSHSAGRYYAAVVQKLILAHVLMNYDCELADEKAERSMWWRTSITPLSKTAIIFRSRTATPFESKPQCFVWPGLLGME